MCVCVCGFVNLNRSGEYRGQGRREEGDWVKGDRGSRNGKGKGKWGKMKGEMGKDRGYNWEKAEKVEGRKEERKGG